MIRAYLILTAIAIALLIRYALTCYVQPFRDCGRCDGLGKTRRKLGRTWRPCRRCRTTGKRLRHGRRAFNYLTRTRRAAHASPTGPRR